MKVYSCEHCVNVSGFAETIDGVMCMECGCYDVTQREVTPTEIEPGWDAPLIASINMPAIAQIIELGQMMSLVDGRY